MDVKVEVAERLQSSTSLEAALEAGVLEPSFTSQLTALSGAAHADGMARLRQAAESDPGFRLEMDLKPYATWARKPG